jgi:predicted NUDIX family NTP pyrophosphohydrolase
MPRKSAGILLFRFKNGEPEVFLAHPGGPLWRNKDLGAWSIPKGEFDHHEDPLAAAKREFEEETGTAVDGEFISLTPVKGSNKIIYAFALNHDFDPSGIKSNLFPLEWPPRSGKFQDFPEIDKGDWFDFESGLQKVNKHQAPLIRVLYDILTKAK